MEIRVPREFRLQDIPATIHLSDEDIFELAEPFPAEVILGSEYAEITFHSPRAAVDFVESFRGQIPYSASGMTADEDAVFNDPRVRANANQGAQSRDPQFTAVDRPARRWSVAAFSVASSSIALSIAALVVGIIALVP